MSRRIQEPVQLVLVFSDELRRRVAWKSISQAASWGVDGCIADRGILGNANFYKGFL